MKMGHAFLWLLATFSPLAIAQRKISTVVDSDVIPNQYIVIFKDNVPDISSKLQMTGARYSAPSILFHYKSGIQGAAVTGLSADTVQALMEDQDVALIEPDKIVRTTIDQSNPPSWGLDRIDQTSKVLNNKYSYQFTGTGVQAYILDSGLRTTHEDFNGRASCGFSIFADCQDKVGHGTHVAGTIGGTLYGVAKGVSLISVKVMGDDGSGSISGVLAGIDFVRQQRTNNPNTPMVVNMSIGGSKSGAFNSAVNDLVSAGVVVAVAAGNDSKSACKSSPASAAGALTVGATTKLDRYSNFGSCVDVFAPGTDITSVWSDSDTASNTISGTSMATPHVTGAAALYLQANPTWTPSQVAQALKDDAAQGIKRLRGSPNMLLNTEKITVGIR